MDLRVGVSAVAMNWLIMLYFIILFAERVQSIVRSIRDKDVKLFGSGFDSYVYLLCSYRSLHFLFYWQWGMQRSCNHYLRWI